MYRRLIWWSAIGFCVPIAWGIMLPTLSSDWLTLWQVEAWRVAWVPGMQSEFPRQTMGAPGASSAAAEAPGIARTVAIRFFFFLDRHGHAL
jgi:hypothetical protein